MFGRSHSQLGVFGTYVLGHFFLRGKDWHMTHGYLPRGDARFSESVIINPAFTFQRPADP
jgi:hypothetical protein